MAESSTLLNTADHPAEDSLVDRKSEFIGDACHADTLAEALAFVDTIRERHPKARHVAYAAICGGQGQMTERMSDDGEPSGTAGKPILDVLRANGLTDCVVTVTRYFGGILLGSGGLTRAYSSAASLAIKAAELARIVPCVRFRLTVQYPQLDKLSHLIVQSGGSQSNEQYTDVVTLDALIAQEQEDSFVSRVVEAFRGSVHAEKIGVEHQAIQ
ncbi:IMPACT family protein [Bifidobacterium boum]|uniref:YigZ family protein n=1 Tax=Bifidobacterium boum TaxID=78343 RepID=A0A086ZIT7_9BIFI|nr:YigZ family protein [Bifidobacterium boum]KFI46437.1 hypothetical protein BBOU_1529 [Bifidobacterium boum]MCF2561915.1 YigZ family protein [Bifidobacterium boum]MDD6087278.1 IMPACT family protein [Bifidobacterium boum]